MMGLNKVEMKPANNNEIDLLLRRLARDDRATFLGGEENVTFVQDRAAEHLDADELSSYAEGVLPAATRSRYTAHLADCAACRSIVAQLVRIPGVTHRSLGVKERLPEGFWQKLSAFFSPAVLRFAVPALAVLAIATVAIVVLRQDRRVDYVAQKQSTQAENRESYPQAAQVSNGAREASDTKDASKDSKQRAAVKGENDEINQRSGEQNARAGASRSEVSSQDSQESDKSSAAAAQPSFAPEPSSPTGTRTEVGGVKERPKEEIAREKEESSDRGDVAQQRDDKNRTGKDAADTTGNENLAKSKNEGPSLAGRSSQGLRTPSVAGARKSNSDSEVRTVSGRQFRFQNNMWVDASFNSGRPITNVARGSEQYRALIADEPAIRAIAEQLKGVVLVVWKGRAYRLQ